MKEYYGFVSFSGRVAFRVKAKNKEEAKDIVFSDINSITVDVPPESPVEIEFINWDIIDKEVGGNVSEAYISDFEMYED